MTTFKKLSTLMMVLALTLCLVFSFASCNLFGGEGEQGGEQGGEGEGQQPGGEQGGETPECEHADNNKDHNCDSCGEALSECADETKDHLCDTCGKALSECADADNNHLCDLCGKALSECADEDEDHLCDLCGEPVSECADEDDDHLCDLCGEPVSECADGDKDHYCDVCGEELTKCVDDVKDHLCDVCGAKMSDCYDGEPKDHVCNHCGGNVGGECSDSETDYDHNCDYCGKTLADCADGEDADHACDVCAKSLCADGEDADHNCDVCQMNLCDDADNNHACDVCGAKLCYDSADRGHTCDVCGDLLCKDADGDKACDVCGDPVGAETLPVITVYVEGANCTVNGKTAVRFYGSEEDKSVVPSYTADQYIIDLWVVYNGEGTKIAYLENGDAFVPAENGTYYIAPIFLATNLEGVAGAGTTLDVSDTDKLDDAPILPEWADKDASNKLTIFGQAPGQYPNHILASSPNAQLYITTDPTNSANVVLMHATRNGATGGLGNTAFETPLAAGSKGDSYLISFDYYLDHNCSGADSTDIVVVRDSNGVEYKIGVVVAIKSKMNKLDADTATPTEGAVRIAGRYYKENAKGYLTGNDGKLYTDAGGDTVYLNSDTWYTFSIEITGNTIVTYWSLRGSDERAVVSTYDYSNFSLAEKELVAMSIDSGLYNSQHLAYFDNLYFGKQHKCVDADSNHACDECEAKLCVDGKDLDHLCDVCGDSLCSEGDIADHYCDGCGAKLSECADEPNKNHYCDICGKGGFGGNECVDDDPKADGHNCNYCNANLCVDADKNHVCDVCEAVLSECADADENHNCDYCGKEGLTTCVDDDKNHDCDLKGCEAVVGEHADAAGDKDHLCDYGCGKEASECVDTDTNYVCDECEKALCYDADNDHICDIEAHKATGEKLSECVDADKNHVCDFEGCKAAVGTHADGETVNHVCDYCGKYDATWCTDVNKDHVCDLEECGKKISYCADTDADNNCDHCGEHLCSDANADRICDNCKNYIVYNFETNNITSGNGFQILHVMSSEKKATEASTTDNVLTSITANGLAEAQKYGAYYKLGLDPANAANTVLSLTTIGNSGGGAWLPNYIKVAPTVIDEGGALIVLELDVYVDSASASGKNAIHLTAYTDACNAAYGTGISTGYQNVSLSRTATVATNSNGESAYQLKIAGTACAASSNEWIRVKYVLDTVDNTYSVYYSIDGGKTFAAIKENAAPSNTARIANFADVTYMGVYADTYNTTVQSYVDNLSVVRVNSVSVPVADGSVTLD